MQRMIKVKLLSVLAGPDVSGHAGDEITVDESFARDLCGGGHAEYVATVETATAEPAEIATPDAQKPETATVVAPETATG